VAKGDGGEGGEEAGERQEEGSWRTEEACLTNVFTQPPSCTHSVVCRGRDRPVRTD
jgi:hypothetical protein